MEGRENTGGWIDVKERLPISGQEVEIKIWDQDDYRRSK